MSDLPWNLSYFRDPDFIASPVATAATGIEEDRFVAHWDAVEDAVTYELDVAADEDFDELVTPGGVPAAIDALGPLEYQLTGLAPEAGFFYRVRAVKASGSRSANSNVIEATTNALFVAQGGDLVTYDGEYSRHFFTTIGAAVFEVLQGLRRVRRLIVAGGGQGGGVNGSGVSCGGGGGGGVLDLAEEDRPALGVGEYDVVVGKGGSVAGALNVGEDGDDSTFDTDTAVGGGHGGSAGASVGSGGSGGGAVNSIGTEFGGLGTPGQGFDGGDANAGSGGGAGGGGAAEPGEDGTGPKGGDGGDGLVSDISGEEEYYGAGGGGAARVANFEPIGATPGQGGAGGGGVGRANSAGPGGAATGIGAGGGGAIGNNPGGAATKGTVVLKYKGRAADITPPPPDPAEPRGPILFADCERLQVVDGVEILVDCNSKNNTGIYPDYREYRCLGGGVIQSSRWDPAYGSTTGNDGILVFRFSEPIRKFTITRRVTANVEAIPKLVACDDYLVIPSPSSYPPGSSQDGGLVGYKTQSPQQVYYPTPHLEPPVNLAAEEEMSVEHAAGFMCVVIFQGPDTAPVRTSEFVDPTFILLSD